MLLFTLWYGAYGAIAAYVGTLVGAGFLASDSFSGHPEIAILWAVAGLLQVLIPLAAVRNFEVDLAMVNPRDWTYILIFGVIVNNLFGAAWGAWTLALVQPGVDIFPAWLIGNIVVTFLIVPLALRHFTPRVRRSRLFVKNYWD
jgi:integral membrane sensor domain MASE1